MSKKIYFCFALIFVLMILMILAKRQEPDITPENFFDVEDINSYYLLVNFEDRNIEVICEGSKKHIVVSKDDKTVDEYYIDGETKIDATTGTESKNDLPDFDIRDVFLGSIDSELADRIGLDTSSKELTVVERSLIATFPNATFTVYNVNCTTVDIPVFNVETSDDMVEVDGKETLAYYSIGIEKVSKKYLERVFEGYNLDKPNNKCFKWILKFLNNFTVSNFLIECETYKDWGRNEKLALAYLVRLEILDINSLVSVGIDIDEIASLVNDIG